MQTRDDIKKYLKQVAREEGFDDDQTLTNIDNWKTKTIERILNFKIQKHSKELKNLPPASPKEQEISGKIASLEEVKSKLSQYQ